MPLVELVLALWVMFHLAIPAKQNNKDWNICFLSVERLILNDVICRVATTRRGRARLASSVVCGSGNVKVAKMLADSG